MSRAGWATVSREAPPGQVESTGAGGVGALTGISCDRHFGNDESKQEMRGKVGNGYATAAPRLFTARTAAHAIPQPMGKGVTAVCIASLYDFTERKMRIIAGKWPFIPRARPITAARFFAFRRFGFFYGASRTDID
jgi:hypothetical protein